MDSALSAPPAAGEPAGQRLIERFRLESAHAVRGRVGLLCGLFAVLMGFVVVRECLEFPTRRIPVLVTYALELAGGVLTIALSGRPRLVRDAPRLAATFAAWVSVCMSAYNGAVQGEPTRLVMGQISWLAAVVVLMPWSWRHQLAPAVAAVVSVAASGPVAPAPVDLPFLMVALVNGAATSVLGSALLERHRRDAYVQAFRHRQAMRAQQEEAEISTTLLRVTETLSRHVDRPGMLAAVTELAVEALACDWSSIFLLDPRDGVYRLHANTGSSPAVRAVLAHFEFPPDSLPLVEALRRDTLVEIPDTEHQTLLPLDLARRTENASSLFVAVHGRNAEMVGALACGYRQRTGPFSSKQRRLALGIAHATTVALETARLVSDLQSANRLRSEFVSTISHELRTPLHVMVGYLEMARDPDFAGEQRDDLLARTESAARELLDLVETTLDLSRMEAGRDELRLRVVALPELWLALRDRLAHLPRPAAVEVRWQSDPPPVSLITDPRKLELILRNLVGNALKFTERGHVAVTVAVDEDTLVLHVIDTGIGIAPADQRTIFEMFRQVDGSDTRRFGGVGLGLHIVHRLTEQLGGTVGVSSAPGEGSDFVVRLPRGGPQALPGNATTATAA